jgi:hypothetical protein
VGRIEASIGNGTLIVTLWKTPEGRNKHKTIAVEMVRAFHRHGYACVMGWKDVAETQSTGKDGAAGIQLVVHGDVE